MENKEIQNKNSGKNTEEEQYIRNCFTITEVKQSKTYDIRLAHPSISKNVVFLNQLFSYLHHYGILAIRKGTQKGCYISIPLEIENHNYIPDCVEKDHFYRDISFEDVEHAINDFTVQQRDFYVTENGQMEDFLWCIHCNKGHISEFLEGDIYNNEYGILCDACRLVEEEKVEQEVDERYELEKAKRTHEEEMERKDNDEE